MSIQIALQHRTAYRFDRPVGLTPHVVRLRPAPHCRTPVHHYSLRIQPEPHFLNWQQDPYGNHLARIVFPEKVTGMAIEVGIRAEMTAINPFDFFLDPHATTYPITYESSLQREAAGYYAPREKGAHLRALVKAVRPAAGTPTIDALVAINRAVHARVNYIIRLEPGVQTCEDTLTRASGSCRDSAWLLVETLRHLGLAARFVSGYLVQLKPDAKPLEGPAGTDKDFTDLHAWAEVYLPGAGWVGLDATSGLLAGEGHIPVACAPDPQDAAPVTGATDECESTLKVDMAVTRLVEPARVTKPYTEEQWQSIAQLGQQVDKRLEADDVRLTMGGEPTFVAADDMDGPEWNILAQGPTKHKRAGELLKRLRRRFAPGGLLHSGSGKWYPGESLPRWALSCVWRRDGQPIWRDENLIAEDGRDTGCDAAVAAAFIRRLATTLKVEDGHVLPGYEDAWYYLWREQRLPVNVDPQKSNLKDPEARARLAKVFERDLGHVVGYALPLCAVAGTQGRGWLSGPWHLRAGTLYLIPGDSPMGLRLPLESLPWVHPHDDDLPAPPDPLAPLPPLPFGSAMVLQAPRAGGRMPGPPDAGDAGRRPSAQESAPWLVRTALCVEPRAGLLHVFLPPVACTEDYLDLVAAVENTARDLRQPVRVEGYPPPQDPRLNHFRITPDPGVIEVNVHPSHRWNELVDLTEGLYEDARQTRLRAEKFMLDGRHAGTGGGNHIVLGGTTPADSPFLRRPALLRRLIAYWHNHPSLSFLFSGLFVGPTSQAPRVDEARNDSLYELELAFTRMDSAAATPPWLVDRLLRNLLINVTGNTHRAEFCIDKLYPPESADGRRGLVELRAFEMPPHARMSLAQQLLVRALIARFWREPYDTPLVRWGTDLHDRYMLPYFIGQDFDDVIADLRRAGFAFEPGWFAPHTEFRFPRVGAIECAGISLELRQALEPWLALGEEAIAGGTARYVDSSVERLQVQARGLIGGRHVIACNGVALPLTPTGTVGEYVAGVRYRAWHPPACLHPTIGVHAPLVFDLLDTWNDRALGGCTYHVAHPGGRSHDRFPVNALEAEGRRFARFFPMGHTPGPIRPQPPPASREFPMTLDLRGVGSI